MKKTSNILASAILALVMSVSLILGSFPASALADSEVLWYIKDDFSMYTTNAAADGVTVTSGDTMVLENEDKTNKYFKASAEKGAISFSQDFKSTASIDNFNFSIDFGFEGGLSSADITLKTSSGNFTPIKIAADKGVLAYDGKKLSTLSSDKLTTISFTFNQEHSRYSVYVNDKKVANNYLINVTVPSTFTGYSINANLKSELELYTDNVYAYSSDKIISKSKFPRSQYNEDAVEVVEYEDIFYDDRRIIDIDNFDDDPRVYSEEFRNIRVEYYANNNIIELEKEDDGNQYLSMEGMLGGQNLFAVLDCGGRQQVVVQFDVCTPTLSTIKLMVYDANGNSFLVLSSDTNMKLSTNKVNAGFIDNKKWVRVSLVLDNLSKLTSVYVDGVLTAKDVPLPSDKLSGLDRIRFYAGREHEENKVMLDNVVVYTGTEIYDYSDIVNDKIDENSTSYSHNIKGNEEFLKSYNAIHTVTGKLYVGGMDKVTKMPYWQDDVLYVCLPDAEKLVYGSSSSKSEEFVALEKFAQDAGKFVTYNRTNTVLVGDKIASISDNMIKTLNAYMTYDRPSQETLKSSFEASRPRLTISAEKLAKIKSDYGKNEYITKWGNSFIKEAEKLLSVEPQEFVDAVGQDGRMLAPARTMNDRILKLAFAFHLTGEQKYVDRAWVELEQICNYPHWHQAIHELDSTMLAVTVAYGYDWLYDQWTPAQRKKMEDAIYNNQLDLTQEAYHGIRWYGPYSQDNNWNPHCNGYAAMAAIAIYESNPEKCADIISNAINMLDYAILNFYPDGAWYEGIGYWGATVASMIEFCSSLVNTFGSSYNIENTACFDITADYLLNLAGPAGTNNFNDADVSQASSTSAFLWFAKTFDRPDLASIRLSDKDDNPGIFDMCYLDTDMKLEQEDIPLDAYMDGLELVSFKSAQGDPNATFVSFHSDNNIESQAHSHIDAGTFVLDMLGERFASDPGTHYYHTTGHGQAPNMQPNNETITRWNYYQHIPEGHNTLVINPDDTTMGQNIITDDKMEAYVSKPRGAYAITSLASAYKGFAKDVRRGVMLGDDRRSVTIRDEIKLNEGDNDIYWFMQTNIANNITYVDDKTAIMEIKGKKVKLMVLTDAATIEMYDGPCTQMFLTPAPEQIPIKSLKRFTIKLTAKDSVYLQVKFIPLDDPLASINPENISLDNWSVPDGEIRTLPYINNIYINGIKEENFDPDSYSITIPVDIKTTDVPEITWDIDDGFEAEITKYAANIDDTTLLRVWRKDDPTFYRIYTVGFNPYSLEGLEPFRITPVFAEASDVPQQENGTENSYDKDLNTYWGASGEGHWLIADLGEIRLVDFVGVAFRSGDARQTKYQLFISEDKENWEMVFDGVSSGATKDIELSKKISKNARYIKLVGYGNTSNAWNSITEICAYSLGF